LGLQRKFFLLHDFVHPAKLDVPTGVPFVSTPNALKSNWIMFGVGRSCGSKIFSRTPKIYFAPSPDADLLHGIQHTSAIARK
jgi:hypothetical protein